MEQKLSSNKIIPAACLAISVPYIPIAKPISAFFKAGASLDPSPVAATIYFNLIKPATKVSLSKGLALANTLNYF